MKRLITLSPLVGLILSIVLPAPAFAAAPNVPRIKKPFPSVQIDRPVRGEKAIRALGASLPEVAAWYGKTTAEFARLIREDKDLWLDTHGRLHVIDEGLMVAENGVTTDGTNTTLVAQAPLDQTFLLHSKPGANRIIYLDFLGGTISGSAWNSSYGVTTINAKPFDTDGVATDFSATELQNIQNIWHRVAEDYAPFDVDVTTELPTAEKLTRTSASDTTFGTRVMITNDWTSATSSPCNCGGIGYIGIFDDLSEFYKPAWVFFDKLGNGNEKFVAEAISHEAGHNLGLYHDGFNNGTTSTGYYSGHGSGATGWAPIMGVGYNKELTQWSKGEYPYATNTEDDLAIIQVNGAPLRTDDHGNDMPGSTVLGSVVNAGSQTLTGSGVITTRSDLDIFRFGSGSGTISVNLTPYERGPNLDISMGLYDAGGTLLASSNPVDGLGANISLANAPSGVYYLLVDGSGKGDLATGYTDYGSLGKYTISGSAPAADGVAPVAQLSATPISGTAPLTVNFSSSGSYDPDGGSLSYLWNFGDGTTSSLNNPSHLYNAAGSYVASLTVSDISGASDTTQTTINVTPAPLVSMHVENIAMALVIKRKNAQATATITVLDASGKAVNGATINGTWSGVVSGAASGVTGTTGSIKLTSPSTTKSGTFTFTVTGIGVAGYTYVPTENKETSDSITR